MIPSGGAGGGSHFGYGSCGGTGGIPGGCHDVKGGGCHDVKGGGGPLSLGGGGSKAGCLFGNAPGPGTTPGGGGPTMGVPGSGSAPGGIYGKWLGGKTFNPLVTGVS